MCLEIGVLIVVLRILVVGQVDLHLRVKVYLFEMMTRSEVVVLSQVQVVDVIGNVRRSQLLRSQGV